MTKTLTVNVTKVHPRKVRVAGGWTTKFDVSTTYRAPLNGGDFETFDPFAAETCRQAEASGRSVVVTYRETSWAHEITGVELAPAQAVEGAA